MIQVSCCGSELTSNLLNSVVDMMVLWGPTFRATSTPTPKIHYIVSTGNAKVIAVFFVTTSTNITKYLYWQKSKKKKKFDYLSQHAKWKHPSWRSPTCSMWSGFMNLYCPWRKGILLNLKSLSSLFLLQWPTDCGYCYAQLKLSRKFKMQQYVSFLISQKGHVASVHINALASSDARL